MAAGAQAALARGLVALVAFAALARGLVAFAAQASVACFEVVRR